MLVLVLAGGGGVAAAEWLLVVEVVVLPLLQCYSWYGNPKLFRKPQNLSGNPFVFPQCLSLRYSCTGRTRVPLVKIAS